MGKPTKTATQLGRVIVLGAGGFLGANLCRHFLALGCQVLGVCKPSTDRWRLHACEEQANFSLAMASLDNKDELHRIFKTFKPDSIFNAAVRGAYVDQQNISEVLAANVVGVGNLLDVTSEFPYRVMVQFGSSSEYGSHPEPLSETTLPKPTTVYAAAKLGATSLVQAVAATSGKPLVVLRLFSVFGPWERSTRLFPQLFLAVAQNRPLVLAKPEIAHDFIAVSDVCFLAAQAKKLLESGGPGAIFNLGTGVATNLQTVADTLETIVGHPLSQSWQSFEPRPWDRAHWIADTTKVQSALGWEPTAFAVGLQHYWKWWQTEGNSWYQRPE